MSRDKLSKLYLQLQNTYEHQTKQGAGKVVIYHKSFLPLISHAPLITWPRVVNWHLGKMHLLATKLADHLTGQ